MKYIIVRDKQSHESAIVFEDCVSHRQAARIHRADQICVVSAGFYRYIPEGEIEVYGESETLGIGHREEDEAIIGRLLKI